jgi:hypothetical protein
LSGCSTSALKRSHRWGALRSEIKEEAAGPGDIRGARHPVGVIVTLNDPSHAPRPHNAQGAAFGGGSINTICVIAYSQSRVPRRQ